MTVSRALFVLSLLLVVIGVTPARADVVTVSVAGGMTDVFKKLAGAFQAVNPDITLQLNFASSGALAKQISQGAPADIFVSANTTWMDYLVKDGRIDSGSVFVFVHNKLVFIGNKSNSVDSLAALEKLDRIALGSPKSVPVGQYAEQAMRAVGVYKTLLAANKFIMAKDVRQALMYADRGEVDGAFVYLTDALMAERAVILFSVPEDLYLPIDFLLGMTPAGGAKESARLFFKFLKTGKALDIVTSFGFQIKID